MAEPFLITHEKMVLKPMAILAKSHLVIEKFTHLLDYSFSKENYKIISIVKYLGLVGLM